MFGFLGQHRRDVPSGAVRALGLDPDLMALEMARNAGDRLVAVAEVRALGVDGDEPRELGLPDQRQGFAQAPRGLAAAVPGDQHALGQLRNA